MAVATSWCNFLRIIIVRHDISLQQVVLVEELVPDDFGIWQIYLSSYLFDICDNIYMHIYIYNIMYIMKYINIEPIHMSIIFYISFTKR